MENKPKIALIYCRVSSERQVIEGNGIKSQEIACRQYAQTHGYEVEKVFHDDGVSGGLFDRPAMKALIKYLEAHPFKKYIVIFDDIKRLARDVEVHFKIRSELTSRGATVESPRFKIEETPAGKFVETMLAASAEFERNENRLQVMSRMKARLQDGYWTFGPPPGLKNGNTPVRGKILVAHEPMAAIIRLALELYAKDELNTLEEVSEYMLKEIEKAGLKRKFSISSAKIMLMNPLYAGYIEYKKWDIPLQKAQHTGLISFTTFNRIQDKLNGKATPRLRDDYNKDFPLRGYVTCAACGRKLTGSWNKGRTKSYANYSCMKKGCQLRYKSIPKSELETAFQTLLENVKPEKELLQLATAVFEETWNNKKTIVAEQIKRTEKDNLLIDTKVSKLMERISTLNDANLIQVYETEIQNLLKQKKNDIQHKTHEIYSSKEFGTAMDIVFGVLSDPLKMWNSPKYEDKRTIISMYFDAGIAYDRRKKFGTTTLAYPVKLINEIKDDQNNLVEMSGIEPESN